MSEQSGEPESASSSPPGTYNGIPRAVIRRSLIISTLGTTLGSLFFPLLAGNIFNRYLEFLGLKERIGIFLALSSLAATFQVLGSWMLQRSGRRRLFFFLFAGPPRMLWLAMITIPLWGPPDKNSQLLVLGVVYFAYWLLNGVSSNAWFSWMRDIVPEDFRGRLWSYRATLITLVGATWGFVVGYLLERLGLSLFSFELIYGIGVVFGLFDIACFFFVHHPPMETKSADEAGLIQMLKAAMHKDFMKFAGVQSIWWFSCSMVFLSSYHLMRGIGMEIFSIQQATLYGTIVFLIFSLLWGGFLDKYGCKSTFCVGMITHAVSTLALAIAPFYGEVMVYVGYGFMNMSTSGLELANTNLLFTLSSKEDQAMSFAARSVIAGIVQATAYIVCENALYPGLKALGTFFGTGPLFYLVVVYLMAFALRVLVFVLALSLPEVEAKPPAGIIVKLFYTTNPLRALYSMGKFLQFKSKELVTGNGDSTKHPSGRWRAE
jgi:MFS family permease